MKNKFWEFKNFVPNEVADLYIYNEISSWDDENFTSANSFKQELDTLGDIKTINLYINSPGGSVADGLAIASMLKRHKAYVIAHVDSMACSIASVIVCSCDKVIMPKNTLLMIHNALMGGFFYGNAKDFRKQADDLDKISESLRQTYLEKASGKLTEDKLIELMNAETWLTAKESLELGLCDEIIESKKMVAKYGSKIFSNFVNVPQDIKNLLDKEEANMEDEIKDTVVDENADDVAAEEIESVIEDVTATEDISDESSELEAEPVIEDNTESEVTEGTEAAETVAEEEVIDETKNSVIMELEAKIKNLEQEKAELEGQLNVSNEKVIELNDKIALLTPIVDAYNAEQEKAKAEADAKLVNEKRTYYQSKFERVGAKAKFHSEEIQNLISNCAEDDTAISKLNAILADMIDVSVDTGVVITNRVEGISKLTNLIPTEESVEDKYGFK